MTKHVTKNHPRKPLFINLLMCQKSRVFFNSADFSKVDNKFVHKINLKTKEIGI